MPRLAHCSSNVVNLIATGSSVSERDARGSTGLKVRKADANSPWVCVNHPHLPHAERRRAVRGDEGSPESHGFITIEVLAQLHALLPAADGGRGLRKEGFELGLRWGGLRYCED